MIDKIIAFFLVLFALGAILINNVLEVVRDVI